MGGGPYGADGDAEQPRHVGLRQVLEAAQHQQPGQGRTQDEAEFGGGRAAGAGRALRWFGDAESAPPPRQAPAAGLLPVEDLPYPGLGLVDAVPAAHRLDQGVLQQVLGRMPVAAGQQHGRPQQCRGPAVHELPENLARFRIHRHLLFARARLVSGPCTCADVRAAALLCLSGADFIHGAASAR